MREAKGSGKAKGKTDSPTRRQKEGGQRSEGTPRRPCRRGRPERGSKSCQGALLTAVVIWGALKFCAQASNGDGKTGVVKPTEHRFWNLRLAFDYACKHPIFRFGIEIVGPCDGGACPEPGRYQLLPEPLRFCRSGVQAKDALGRGSSRAQGFFWSPPSLSF